MRMNSHSVAMSLFRSLIQRRFICLGNFCRVSLENTRKMSVLAGKRVYVTRRVPSPGVELLKSAGLTVTQWDNDLPVPKDELLKSVPGIDALFCLLTDPIDREVITAAGSSLKIIGTMSVGYEHIDLEECRQKNILIGYTPNVLTEATAELTMALLLATSRRIVEGVHAVKSGEWSSWVPLWMCGKGINGSTVGIVGLGRIGMAVARRLRPFGVSDILYSGRTQKSSDTEVGAKYVSFDELLSASDFVIVTCAMTPETKGLFDKTSFSKMKNSAIFINVSRGGLVNQDDLLDALESGKIGAAGLDVTVPEPLPPSHPLLQLNNCVVFPHIGSATVETRSEMSRLTAKNILAGLQGQTMPAPLNLVDLKSPAALKLL